MKTLLDREDSIFNPPQLGCVLSLTGLPGGDSKIYDRSPYGHSCTIYGATWVKLPSGLWVLSFDGSDDKVDCGNPAILKNLPLGDFSIKVWVYFTANQAAYAGIYSKYDKPHLEFDVGGDNFEFGTGGAGDIHDPNPASTYFNRWTHIVGTQQANDLSLFVNTSLVAGPTTFAGARSTTDSPAYFGWQGAVTRYFDGCIALPRIYNRALSALEIQNSFNREKHLFGAW